MALDNPPQEHAKAILAVFQESEAADMEFSTGMLAQSIEDELPDSVDYSGIEVVAYLTDTQLVEIKHDKLDGFDSELFHTVFGIPMPFNPPEDAGTGELAHEFAKWLHKEKMVMPVLMDEIHDPEDSLIFCYDSERRVWNKNGEIVLQDFIGDELPERNGHSFRKRVQRALCMECYDLFDEMGLSTKQIAVQDGLLDFESNEVRDIEPSDKVLNRLPVSFHDMPEDYPEEWIDFLERSTQDEAAMMTLQEFVGYSLMHWTRKHGKMLMLLGPTRTGKSTFLNVVEELLGGSSNVSNQPLEDLCSESSMGRWTPRHLQGKLANIHPDLDGDKIERVGRAKNLTEDGESINAERKGVSHYEIEPNAKHMYAANSAPSVGNREDAFFNRFLTIRFENQIPREEQDEDLEDKLTKPEVLNGIFKWALDGMKRLQEQGEFTRELSALANRELFSMYDSGPKKFVHEACEFKHKADKQDRSEHTWKIDSDTLHELYEEWARRRATHKLCGRSQFSREVRDIPNVHKARLRVDGSQVRGFSGIRVKDGFHVERMKDEGGDL